MVKHWSSRVVSPDVVLSNIKPGMSIFVGTGVAEPRMIIKNLMSSDRSNLRDLEIIQLLSIGDAIPFNEKYDNKYRLKTFFTMTKGYSAITSGRIDWIPCIFSHIPHFFETKLVRVDAAFVQITPPDKNGICSLGVSADVTKHAIDQASLVVGEINEKVPYTYGDTLINIDRFDYLLESSEQLYYTSRWPIEETFNRIAKYVASLIPDGSCLAFFLGPHFESLVSHLRDKRDLGIHSLFFTDPFMDVIKSGAVSNNKKKLVKGKSVVTYAQGTPELLEWLDCNPLIEFRRIDFVANPKNIARNNNVVVIIPANKVDLTGSVTPHSSKKDIVVGPSEYLDFLTGASLSQGGFNIFALPSRNLKGEPNILLSVEDYLNNFSSELINIVVTEFGVAHLRGRSLRERALSLIDIAHPDDRNDLIKKAKKNNLLYQNQKYNTEAAKQYPDMIYKTALFEDSLVINFRAIKPSDKDGMRALFYRFSDKSIYFRYFSSVLVMPHSRMQEYTDVDYDKVMSIVGFTEEAGLEQIIAEARYIKQGHGNYADLFIIVDEKYQGRGIATYLSVLLMQIAQKKGLKGFNAQILPDNTAMIRVMQKSAHPNSIVSDEGLQLYSFDFPLIQLSQKNKE
jgi:acyl-CoA hydrolase/RimJ/RimL family protein N-acetyltransferase